MTNKEAIETLCALMDALDALEEEPPKWLPQYEGKWVPANSEKWIPVSDPPKTSGRYLAYIGNSQLSYMMTCYYTGQRWCPDDNTASNNVRYWMHLPVEPYEEKKEDEE